MRGARIPGPIFASCSVNLGAKAWCTCTHGRLEGVAQKHIDDCAKCVRCVTLCPQMEIRVNLRVTSHVYMSERS